MSLMLSKGFWKEIRKPERQLHEFYKAFNLIQSEVVELTEAFGSVTENPTIEVSNRMSEECADIILRVTDFIGA